MSDLVNLNRYRKLRRRMEAAKQASENRLRFGRAGAERARTRAEHERQVRDFDGKRLNETRSEDSE